MKKSGTKTGFLNWVFRLFVVVAAIVFWTVNPVIISSDVRGRVEILEENLKRHLVEITKEPYRSVSNLKRQEEVAHYIKSEFEKQGYQVQLQPFPVQGRTAYNVVARYNSKSSANKKSLIVVGAHYDVCFDMPGADDNASGVAGLLELSRAIMVNKPDSAYPIEFVAYANEEPPYYGTEWMGSFVHAQKISRSDEVVELMLSLEMIGYFSDQPNSQNFPIPLMSKIYPDQGNFISIIGNNSTWTVARKVKALMEGSSDIPVYSMNTYEGIHGVDWSDHRSYWKFGYPALMVTDTSFYRNPNYHTPHDTIEKLDLKRMVQVIQGVYGAITHL